MSMLSQTYIGKYYEGSQELSVSTKSIPGQDNDSYVILGESGYGKSVAAQSIVLQKAYQGHRILDLNIHNTSSSEHKMCIRDSHWIARFMYNQSCSSLIYFFFSYTV